MKNYILTACLLAMVPAAASAQEAGRLGAGVELGEQNGGTVKYWLNHTAAVDAALGVAADGDLAFHADGLWHGWDVLPQPPKGKLDLHLGVGGRVRGDDFGIRAIGGVGYWTVGAPLEVYLDLGPIFELTEGGGVDFTGVVGVRFYFNPSKTEAAHETK